MTRKTTTRRAVLTGTAALATAAALPAGGVTNPDAELLALWATIKSDVALYNASVPEDDDEAAKLHAAISADETRLSLMVPQTIGGAVAMLEFLGHLEGYNEQHPGSGFNHNNSCDAFACVLVGLRQLAGKGGAA